MDEELDKLPGVAEVTETPETADVTVEDLPRGRDAFLARYRSANPDIADEPDDDTLFDYAGRGYDERDEWKGNYDKLNASNEQLAKNISEEPRAAELVNIIAGSTPQDMWYNIAKNFPDIVQGLDEEALNQIKAGQAEFKARSDKRRENFDAYFNRLKAFGEKRGLTEEQSREIHNNLLDMAEALGNFEINDEVLEGMWKMSDYESEREALSEAEKLAIKNEAITEQKNAKAQGGVTGIPETKNAKTAAVVLPPPIQKESPNDYVPYIDRLEKVR